MLQRTAPQRVGVYNLENSAGAPIYVHAKICVVDTRLSNTASMADYWLSPWPGSEAAMLLAIVHCMLRDGTWDREFVRRWVNWEEYLREERPDLPVTMAAFEEALKTLYASYTPEFAERESGVPCVPIFWLQTEDHDLAETDHCFVPRPGGPPVVDVCQIVKGQIAARAPTASMISAAIAVIDFGPTPSVVPSIGVMVCLGVFLLLFRDRPGRIEEPAGK